MQVGDRVHCPVMPKIATVSATGTVVEVRGLRPFQEARVRYDSLQRGPDWFWSRRLVAVPAVDQLADLARESCDA